ncbi:hypothetical protein FLA_5389 [Filimonas lacunae]|nr:hypothetical protein FLA_5389 [Filimonas lacunae]
MRKLFYSAARLLSNDIIALLNNKKPGKLLTNRVQHFYQ